MAGLLFTPAASAEVRFEGDWPSEGKRISLSAEQTPRTDAIRKLAVAAGWSVIIEGPSNTPVTVQVENQPADRVLGLLLHDGSWVAHRDGSLVSISAAPSEASPKPQDGSKTNDTEQPPANPAKKATKTSDPPAASSAPPKSPNPKGTLKGEGKDRFVTGSDVTIAKEEVVRDLVVMGGSVKVHGRVTGDLFVLGGSAVVHPGGQVLGDGVVMGGSLNIRQGGEVRGDHVAMGGAIHENGELIKNPGMTPWDDHGGPWTVTRVLAHIAGAVARTALLFLFGAMLMALLTTRMERLQIQVATLPMQSLAWGLLGSLLTVVAMGVLAISCIGLPFAGLLGVVAIFAAGAGLVAVLSTIGAALIQHKNQNPYVHLALGCALFLVASSVPFVGGLVTLVLLVVGLGTVVATRGAGLLPTKRPAGDAYRTAATP